MKFALAATIALLLPAIGAAERLAHSAAPGRSGLVAFSRYRTFVANRPVRREIWVANPDGSGLRRLTHVAPNYVDVNPDWAPDGSRLVFNRCAPVNGEANTDNCTIWTVKRDGSGQQRLSPACKQRAANPCPVDGGGGGPQYSPDGRLLAFDRDLSRDTIEDTSIVVSDTALRHAHVIFTFGRKSGVPHVGSPTWSPDGKWLAFGVSCCDQPTRLMRGSALFVVGVDGKGLRRITSWSLRAGEPSWSPDGTRILFSSTSADNGDPGPAGGNIYTVRPDGTNLHELTHLAPSDGVQLGSYSPDGTSIVFTTRARATPSLLGGEPRLWPDVFTIKIDGTALTNITKSTNWEGTPDWGS